MGPSWPPVGGSSQVWEQQWRRPSSMPSPNKPVRLEGLSEQPLLLILTPSHPHKGRSGPRDSLEPRCFLRALQVRTITTNCTGKWIGSQWSCCKRGHCVNPVMSPSQQSSSCVLDPLKFLNTFQRHRKQNKVECIQDRKKSAEIRQKNLMLYYVKILSQLGYSTYHL